MLNSTTGLPHEWSFTFESIQEEGLTWTDALVATVGIMAGSYLAYQNGIGGHATRARMRHWWTTDARRLQREVDEQADFHEALMNERPPAAAINPAVHDAAVHAAHAALAEIAAGGN